MITLKSAFRSVFRRPQQNISVILGIALGVSLFVGVQVGSDSIGASFTRLTVHEIGERDAEIVPSITPFFVTKNIINEELSPIPINSTPLTQSLEDSESFSKYIKAMSTRLDLISTVLEPVTGAIEVGKQFSGIDENQNKMFGNLFNRQNVELEISDLNDYEIFIGEEIAENLFGEGEDPVGKNLTLQTTIFTLSQPQFNITSVAIPLSFNLTIADVFLDEGLGRERFSNYIISRLDVVQQLVVVAYNAAKLQAFFQGQNLLSFGSSPLTSIYLIWDEIVETEEDKELAIKAIEEDLEGIVSSDFSQLFLVLDTRGDLQERVEDGTEQLELLLNGFGAIIILAGVLVIINIQSMALAARERETGILRALGAKRSQIVVTNLLESIFLGLIGSIAGLGGGILYGRLLIAFLGFAFEFPSGAVETIVLPKTLISSFIAGFILSQVTGLLPAIKASRINIARVLRGIEAPPRENFGRKSLYFGIIVTIVGILGILLLDPNPIIDGNEAFKDLDDIQASYFPIILAITGPAILVGYFKNQRLGVSVVGVLLLGWAYFNIFYILDFVETGSSGLRYIVYLVGSLLVGTIIFMGANLGSLASLGQRIASWLARSRTTPVRGTTMVAFRKMRSKVSRSTLTFALFATILTLNIWIGTFSFSFRYGLDTQTIALTGEADILIYSPDNLIPNSLDFSQELIDEFGKLERETYITETRGFLATPTSPYYWDELDSTSQRLYKAIGVQTDSFWEDGSQEEWIFPFDLEDNKTNTPFEVYEDQEGDNPATIEDEKVWKAVANNETIPNKDGIEKPVLISTFIFDFSPTEGFVEGPVHGDSIFLNLTDGRSQEFVIGAISGGGPLSDFNVPPPTDGPPEFNPVFYVSNAWKNKLLAFNGLTESQNVFIAKTNVDDPTSDKLFPLLQEIEKWANAGEFKQKNGLFGFVGITTYSIYEEQLEGLYRFFQFLQAFVSLGFAVGILGLVVVASRSVAERKREIGMLRALGFRRRDIVVSVVLELIVLGMIGLFIGFINGTVMGYALTNVFGSGIKFLIPWNLVAIYGVATLFSAILAAIFPAIRASKIPASDALRYTG